MQILARYIASAFLKNLVLALSGLTVLFFFQTLLTKLNDFPIYQLLIFTFYDIPQMMVVVAPPSALVATVLTFSGLSKTNELVACYSIGISVRQMVSVIFPVVFVMCCLSLVVQDRILPAFYEKKSLFYWRDIKKQQDFFLDVKQDKIWYRSNNMIYHIKTFNPQNQFIEGVGIYVLNRDWSLEEFIEADSGYFEGVDSWRMLKAKITRFDQKTGFPRSETVPFTSVKLKERPENFKEIEKEVDRLRIKDLVRFINTNKKAGISTKGSEVKLHSRFALSFIPLIMCLLAVPFSVSLNREGRMGRDILVAFSITFFYWLSFSVSLSLGTSGAISPVLAAWLPSVIFGSFAVFLLKRMQR